MGNKGQFIKGTHWRKPQSYWNKGWLIQEYTILKKSASVIASEQGCTENNILFWLHKHGVPRRTMREVRQQKHWGSSGQSNPQYGVRGHLHPRWRGGRGSRPQGRREYRLWRQAVIDRCGVRCRDCEKSPLAGKNVNAHHLYSWKIYPERRYDPDNGTILCSSCHAKSHALERNSLGRFMPRKEVISRDG